MNNRLDILDRHNKWLEATVVQIVGTKIKVHFKGYVESEDEWVEVGSDRILEVGAKSNAHGWAKYNENY